MVIDMLQKGFLKGSCEGFKTSKKPFGNGFFKGCLYVIERFLKRFFWFKIGFLKTFQKRKKWLKKTNQKRFKKRIFSAKKTKEYVFNRF